MLKEISCCFTGHRYLSNLEKGDLENRLYCKILSLISEKSITRFITGGALGFDTLAAKTVLKVKKDDPRVSLHLILPCKDQCSRWNPKAVEEYNRILKEADSVTFLYETYCPGCMQERNRQMVDQSIYCIAYLNQNKGGTKYTVDYCMKTGIEVFNLGKVELKPARQYSFEDFFPNKDLW